jgi:hypothetical protein
MSTPLTDILPMFNREINIPGAEQLTTVSTGAKLGYIEDGFWDVRLSGMLDAYTVALGENITPPETTGTKYITDQDLTGDDLEQKFWMLITIFAGFRLLRLKIMQLAVNFTAEAGPVSYEQQASATVLRSLLDNLQDRIDQLKVQYSEDFGSDLFVLMDGVAQAEYSALNGLADLQILY